MKSLLRALALLLAVSSVAFAESGGAGQPGGGTHWDCAGVQITPLECPLPVQTG
ncbi:hypothetical protein [Deinococcus sedimenti]|uniref:Uncharacterized protein n=1 Tax=Deinococcus sedimenti TaxID=1867090 RepID=A0ABQ2RY17_9DEIO|nr:hypothetical protein [Deinococcus sedimenti]GGR78351.1 hypothetical protein GCM10008960_01420 [Deinococcus sedimenti]